MSNFGTNLALLDGEPSAADRFQLEDQILLARDLLALVKTAFQTWLARVSRGAVPFDSGAQERFAGALETLATTFGKLESRARGREIAHAHELYALGLEVQSLLKQQIVPVAPVSSAFDEVELSAGNAAFLSKFLGGAA